MSALVPILLSVVFEPKNGLGPELDNCEVKSQKQNQQNVLMT